MAANRSLKLNSFPLRLALLVPALLLLIAMVFVLRWSVASSAATQETNVEIAKLSTELAPDDPQTHFALARMYEKGFLAGDTDKALLSYTHAVALTPYDFRFWLSFAKAQERSGDIDAAERSLRHALTLAPGYAQIHWALGNVLLRQGKTDEAFAEIRLAVERNPSFAATAAVTALQFSGEDPAALAEKLGGSADIQIALALGLARQKKFAESRQIWDRINEGNRSAGFEEASRQLSAILIAEKQFRYAFITGHLAADLGHIVNPGFEFDLNVTGPGPFEWRISEGANPRIGFDNQQKHDGTRSLGIIFAKGSGKDFRSLSQLVTIDGGTAYDLAVFVRSEIQSTGKLRFEIADAASGETIGTTEDIPLSTGDGWQQLTGKFKTSTAAEGVIIRLVRGGCENCSIEGKLWMDDFTLEKELVK